MCSRGVLDDVGHDPHARLGRVDVGVADHELLEDVVLDGPGKLLLRDALLLGGDHVPREHGEHRAVHGHRHRHAVERDRVEQHLHVLDRVDGHAGLADVADDTGMVAVVAAVRGEVEGHREPHLTGGEVGAVEGVRLLRGREARVLPDRPRPVGVHRGPHAAQEGVEPGERVDGFEILEVGGGVQGLHRDALGRDPRERRRIALQLLRRERLPVGDGPVRASRSVSSHGERVEVASSGHELVTRGVLGATRAVLSSPGARLRRCGRGRRRPRGPGGQRPRRPSRHGACWSREPSRPRRRRAGRGCFRCDGPAAASNAACGMHGWAAWRSRRAPEARRGGVAVSHLEYPPGV